MSSSEVIQAAALEMHALALRKPDGRALTLYSREAVALEGPVMSPAVRAAEPNPHLRWHPLRAEWVAYAAHRQDRTYLPSAQSNPLLPSASTTAPTELPLGRYEIAAFDNLFPAFAPAPAAAPPSDVRTRAARGACEVIVFGQKPDAALSGQSVAQLELLLAVWAHRTRTLGSRGDIEYVLPFENRGVEQGVTLHHPHGQIYAYPFVPPVPATMLARELEHHNRTGRALLETLIEAELRNPQRVLYAGEHALCFVPPWARYSYEIWIAPVRACARLDELDAATRRDLARALKVALAKLDALWGKPCPYLMTWYQAPCDAREHPEAHLHAEIWPTLRARDRLKYLAGTELGAGVFTNDSIPEERARELRAVPIDAQALEAGDAGAAARSSDEGRTRHAG